jgi:glycerol-1-phosphate dehydrogenase [NAD(P)+]
MSADPVAAAVARSKAIREIEVGEGILADAAAFVRRHAAGADILLVADENTFAAAGRAVEERLRAAGLPVATHVLPSKPRPKPTVALAESIAGVLGDAIPVSVGSGVLNDVVKYAAFLKDRPYLCVPTAASMDGYSSAGAPLSDAGFKKTIAARAPVAILADLSVVAAAPAEMSGWGYGDLAGKVPAGGDWLVADALGIEPIDDVAWPLVQGNLSAWLADPAGVRAGDPAAIRELFVGLTLSGLAMEFHGTSRPASGADHQIAHMWEMEGLSQRGEPVAHGACVAVGALATLELYDWLLGADLAARDAEAIVAAAPTMEEKRAEMARRLSPALAARAEAETAAKHLDREAHRARLADIAAAWPALRERLRAHVMRAAEVRRLLVEAGAPTRPEDIGIDTARLVETVRAARFIRSRYTILDLLDETRLLDRALAHLAQPAASTAAAPADARP